MKTDLITIGYDKNGEMDFGILGTVQTLTYEQMKELRSMICTAIYVAENMWHKEQESKSLKACQMPTPQRT
jgi:uncharacterized protein (DUF2141 family)